MQIAMKSKSKYLNKVFILLAFCFWSKHYFARNLFYLAKFIWPHFLNYFLFLDKYFPLFFGPKKIVFILIKNPPHFFLYSYVEKTIAC